MNFFAIFLEFYLMRQGGKKRNNNFYFLSPSFFQPILSWNHAIMVFFNFLNFFAIFLEFSITHWVGTKRNYNFYFLSFSTFYILFWLEMKPQWYYLIFLFFFFFFFWIFYYPSGMNGTDRQFLFLLFLGISKPILAWNEAITVSFNLLTFFAIFF